MKAKKLPIFQQADAKQVLSEACKRRSLTLKLLEQLIDLQRTYIGSGRREGVNGDVDSILGDHLDQ
jgi:hypothetical protein